MTSHEAFLFADGGFWQESSPTSVPYDNSTSGTLRRELLDRAILPEGRKGLSSLSALPAEAHEGPWQTEMLLYHRLARSYTDRRMSSAEDILRAFTGIYNAICRQRPNFLPITRTQGIVPHLLPIALLWSTGGSHNNRSPLALGTWTWAHWQGRIFCLEPYAHESDSLAINFSFGPGPAQPLPKFTTHQLQTRIFQYPVVTSLFKPVELQLTQGKLARTPAPWLRNGELAFIAPTLRLPAEDLKIQVEGTVFAVFLQNHRIGHVEYDSGQMSTMTHLVLLVAKPYFSYRGLAVQETSVKGVYTRVCCFHKCYGCKSVIRNYTELQCLGSYGWVILR